MFALFHYLFVTSLLCSRLPLSLPLFCYVSLRSFQGFRCFTCLLRRCCVLGFDCLFLCFVTSVYDLFKVSAFSSVCYVSSRIRLSLLLFVTSLCFLLMVSIVSLSVCYVSLLSL